ncbi:MAG: hypothetical protein VYD57_09280 [Pseudomonadota bacterium]|nr:hypothetical protein [Pseudomonadota bacterium]
MIARFLMLMVGVFGLRALTKRQPSEGAGPSEAVPERDHGRSSMTTSNGGPEKRDAQRIGSTPAANDWDPGPVADAKLIKGFKGTPVEADDADDPLVSKHKADAYRKDFRTVDYKGLSKSEAEREAERRRKRASYSTWTAPEEAPKGEAPAAEAKFANFGGSTVSAEVQHGPEPKLSAPSMMPHLPGVAPLGAPDPRGRTPDESRRSHMPADPLAEKHKAEAFDKDWRTHRYGRGDDDDEDEAVSAEESSADAPILRDPNQAEETLEDVALSGGGPIGQEPLRLDSARYGQPDELTRIEGIGASMERLLFEMGIFHFDQIAGWTEDEIRWVEAKLAVEPGTISRGAWPGRAMALTHGAD